MVKAVIIEKSGDCKSINIKVEKDELYKKCKFKSNDSFSLRHTWKVEKSWLKKHNKDFKYISLYAKDNGRANMENKYDLPPPIDTALYFGCIVAVAHDHKNIMSEEEYNEKKEEGETSDLEDSYLEYVDPIDLTTNVWNLFYEHLFGGFEDLSASALQDEYEEDELDEIPDQMKTSSGYLKDDFVVDDDELIYDEGNSEETSDESEFTISGEQDELQFEEYTYSDEEKLHA
jgi:hypothetical protein